VIDRARARLRSRPALAVLIALFVLYPWLYHHVLPQSSQWIPDTSTAFVIVAFTVMGVGLNVVVGYAGLLDLGYVAFYAAGAYVAGWFASQQFGGSITHPRSWIIGGTTLKVTLGIHLTPWSVILIAACFAALLGVLIGLPTLRLRGDYLAIVTLGFGEIIPQFVRNGDHVGGFNLTNGSFGLTGIDGLGFGTGCTAPCRSCRAISSSWSTRPGTTGQPWRCSGSPSARRSCCATRASGAPGSRSARTRTPRPRWACRCGA
jgi:branched-chain amino acid transport system permease protein